MRKKTNNNSAAKASLGYTVGNFCLKGIGLITVPIFARLLSADDFGAYNTFIACEGIIYIFISLALNASVKNAKYKFQNQIDEYTSSIALLPAAIAFLAFVMSFLFQRQIASALALEQNTVPLLIIYSYCSGTVVLYQSRISLDYNYKEYLKLSIFNVVCSVSLSVFLILTIFDDMRYMGRILGGTISYTIIAIYILYRLAQKARPRFNAIFLKYSLKISVPLIPHGLSQTLLLSFDRIMITKMVGNQETGLYSFAYTIYSIVQIAASSLDTVFSPWVFKELHDKNNVAEVKRIGTCFMLLIAGVITGTILLCPELIYILGGNKYKNSIFSAVPVLFAGFFAMIYCIPAVLEYYHEKTKYISLGTTVAAIVNIILNYFFIKKYGYIGAAYSTLISYVFYFFLHTFISKKISGFSIIDIKYLLGAIVILSIAYLVGLGFREYFVVRLTVLMVLVVVGMSMMVSKYGISNVKKLLKHL